MRKITPKHPGKYIRKFVIPADVSVKEAADLLQIGRPALSNLLNGKASLSPEMASRLAKAFGANDQELIELQTRYDEYQFQKEAGKIEVLNYVPSFRSIRAIQIEGWGATIDARSRLAVFLRRLIHSTGCDLLYVDFPGYDKSEKKGWDGFVDTQSATPWIPPGKSGWEFGTNENPDKKAEHDYNSRTSSIPEKERKEIHFVFVTPRQWDGKKKWVKTKEELNEWKSVRAWDSSDLEQWLEQSIATQSWLSEQLGDRSDDIETLEHFWQNWSSVCEPVLSPELFSDSISRFEEKVAKWLANKPDKPLVVASDSRGESLAFLSALFAKDNFKQHQDRVAILRSRNILEKISTSTRPLIAVIESEDIQKTAGGVFRMHHTILITPKNSMDIKPDISLDQMGHLSFTKTLESMGFNHGQSERLARESGYSPTILRRRLSQVDAIRTPQYQKDPKALRYLVPFTLVGAWNSKGSGDQDIVSVIADCPYSEAEERLSYLLQFEESPVWLVKDFRGVSSKLESLFAIKSVLQEKDITDFFFAAEIVLSEKDPALDLPEENRWAANLYGKTRDHSSTIRHRICETLVLLAVHGDDLFKERLNMDISLRVDRLIERLMSNLTFEKILSLNKDLTYYAEASPKMFLKAIEQDLRTTEPVMRVLMRPTKSGILGAGIYRSDLLWALELLAWNIEFLPRVCYILAELSLQPIDDNYANKPLNSLEAIFRSWFPQTAGTIDDRKSALAGVMNRFPTIGWKICISQFDLNQIGQYSHRPRWRNEASGYGERVTRAEQFEFVKTAFESAISFPAHTRETLGELVQYACNFGADFQQKIWNRIKEWLHEKPVDDDKSYLREQFRISVFIHSRMKDHPEELTPAKEVYELLDADDLVIRHQWLFKAQWLHGKIEGVDDDRHNHIKRDEIIIALRTKALQEIWAMGIDHLDRLIDIAGAPSIIGEHLNKDPYTGLVGEDIVSHVLYSKRLLNESNATEFLRGFIHSLSNELRIKTIRQFLSTSDRASLLRLFLLSPCDSVTWNILQECDEDLVNSYWRDVRPYVYYKNINDLNELASRLLKANRPVAAFSATHYLHDKVEPGILKTMLQRILTSRDETHTGYEFSGHDISTALDSLEKSGEVSEAELADLEFSYIRVLDHSQHGIPNLQRQLASSPLLFVQVIALTYKRSDDGRDPEEWGLPDIQQRKHTFSNTYTLLEKMKHLPGITSDGKVNEDVLRKWVYEVRNLCALHAREEVGDESIGRVLSASPIGDDGIWPCLEVRKIIEEVASPKISQGVYLGISNGRGPVWGPSGAEEMELSETHKSWSLKTAFDFPFVSQMLRDIAESFERHAQWIQNDNSYGERLTN